MEQLRNNSKAIDSNDGFVCFCWLDVYSKVEDAQLVRALRNFPTEADCQSVPVADSDGRLNIARRLAAIQNGLMMMDI